MKFKILKVKDISHLPKEAGVYSFQTVSGKILYIGKARNLKERIKNHFRQPTFKDRTLIEQVKKVGFIKTNSEIEALLLEAKLIKKYQPRYNVVWRDDKNYFFVGITKEDFPRVFITHQPKQKLKIEKEKLKIKYVGPFVEGKTLKLALKVLRKVFPYRSCKKIPKKPCLWFQFGYCPAPCTLSLNQNKQREKIKKEAKNNVKNLTKILKGEKNQVLKDLIKEMKKASDLEDFERAAKIRDQIFALERVLSHARVLKEGFSLFESDWKKVQEILKKILKIKKKIVRIEAYDISNIQGQKATGSMVVFIKGKPDKSFYRKFKIKGIKKPNDTAMIKEILSRRFNHPEWGFPDVILIDGGKAQLNAALKIKNQRQEIKNKIKVISLAKKKKELFIENRKDPILLKNLPREVFNLILQLDDEAHRFAISYHRKLREKEIYQS